MSNHSIKYFKYRSIFLHYLLFQRDAFPKPHQSILKDIKVISLDSSSLLPYWDSLQNPVNLKTSFVSDAIPRCANQVCYTDLTKYYHIKYKGFTFSQKFLRSRKFCKYGCSCHPLHWKSRAQTRVHGKQRWSCCKVSSEHSSARLNSEKSK